MPTLAKMRMLIVGIDAYRNAEQLEETLPEKQITYENTIPKFENLTGAVKDARDVATFFRKTVGLPEDRITVLLGDKQSLNSPHEAVTAGKIMEALVCMALESEKEDWLLFTFSGHGVMAPLETKSGMPSVVPFLVMQNTWPEAVAQTALAFDEVIDIVQREGNALNRMLLLDACNSGRMQQQSSPYLSDLLIERQMPGDSDQGLRNVVFLSAARGFQSSYEDRQGGYFLQAFLRGLRGFARPSNAKVTITLNDAYTYAALETRSRTFNRQTPYVSGGALHYDLLSYGNGKASTCENIFDVSSIPTTHRSNENLTVRVTLKDPDLRSTHEMSLDLDLGLKLLFYWNIDGGDTYQSTMRHQADGVYEVTLLQNVLHSGLLKYGFAFKGGIFKNNFQFEPKNCRWQIRIRQ